MQEQTGGKAGSTADTPAARCFQAWRRVDDAVRSEVLTAIEGLGPDDSVHLWSARLAAHATTTDTALRYLRDSYLGLPSAGSSTVTDDAGAHPGAQ